MSKKEQQDESELYYTSLSTDKLRELMLNGDDDACAYYISARIDEDVMTAEDVKYLESSINNLNATCAQMGAMLFGMKGCLYEDKEKELFCYAVLEQYGDADAHKRLTKAYKKNAKLIDGFDRSILAVAIARYATKTVTIATEGISFFLGAAVRGTMPDFKKAHVFSAAQVSYGKRSEEEALYISYSRDKYERRTITRVLDGAKDLLKGIAEKTALKSFDIYLYNKLDYRFGNELSDKTSSDAVSVTDDEDLKIEVSDKRVTADNICPNCGATMEDGVCPACSAHAESDSRHGSVVIQRAKQKEAMLCTQCNAPLTIEEGGRTAYCPACGTTFIINGNALGCGVCGVDFASVKADMPPDAELPDIKFVRASVMDGKMSAIIPSSFDVMPDSMKKIKYPNNPPEFIYTTPDSTVNLCLNARGALNEENVIQFGRQMLSTLKLIRKDAVFGKSEVIENSKNIFFIDFITSAIDQSIYNAMFFFSIDGKQGIGSWNCLGKDRWFWAPVFEHAVKTIRFN